MSVTEDDCKTHEVQTSGENPGKEEIKIDPVNSPSNCSAAASSDGSDGDKINEVSFEPKNSENDPCDSPVSQCTTKLKKINLTSADNPEPKKANLYDKYVYPCVPKINCAEKIVFCLDMSSDMDQIPFRLGDGSQHSPLNMVKRTIELFVENKHLINPRHEYSVMALYEQANWVKEFTNDPKEIMECLDDLQETEICNACDLSSIVSLLTEKYELGIPSKLSHVRHVFRVILIYGRSNCMITFSNEQNQHILMKYPFMFLDIIYIHEPPSTDNKCEEIFQALCDLDEQNKSYIFEVTRNTTKLHNCMAKLIAHPFQRVAQRDSFYKIRMPTLHGVQVS